VLTAQAICHASCPLRTDAINQKQSSKASPSLIRWRCTDCFFSNNQSLHSPFTAGEHRPIIRWTAIATEAGAMLVSSALPRCDGDVGALSPYLWRLLRIQTERKQVLPSWEALGHNHLIEDILLELKSGLQCLPLRAWGLIDHVPEGVVEVVVTFHRSMDCPGNTRSSPITHEIRHWRVEHGSCAICRGFLNRQPVRICTGWYRVLGPSGTSRESTCGHPRSVEVCAFGTIGPCLHPRLL